MNIRQLIKEEVAIVLEKKKNIIIGGKGDNLNPEDVDQQQLEIGIAVEMEHTNNKDIAEEIALDHLAEHDNYYTKLIKAGLVDEPSAIKLYKKYYGKKKSANTADKDETKEEA